ncbi:MAG TPA: alanine racemase [Patescibacteria group bacterium]|nr:alanine racemase [Patescibacteria group bacterium]
MSAAKHIPRNGRPVWAEISLDAITANFHAIRKWTGGRNVLAVVKADAYGHGGPPVAKALERAGAAAFGVTCVSEGAELRDAGIRKPILVLTGWWDGESKFLFEYNLSPAVHRMDDLAALEASAAAHARKSRKPRFRHPFHLKVDTGMNRLGIAPADAEEFVRRYAQCRHLKLAATFTHFASSEDFSVHQTEQQEAAFADAVRRLRRAGVDPGELHMANSAAVASRPSSWAHMVRPGALLYGYHQNYDPAERTETASRGIQLQPALSLRARIVSIRDVPPGQGIGYNATFHTTRPSRIAVIPAGYADGVVRRLSGKGHVLVRGQEVPIVGVVSMDLSMLDVTDVPGVSVGDVVTIFGADGGRRINPFCVARALGTVTSDLLCSLGKRVPRHYAPSGQAGKQ